MRPQRNGFNTPSSGRSNLDGSKNKTKTRQGTAMHGQNKNNKLLVTGTEHDKNVTNTYTKPGKTIRHEQ